MNRQRCETCGHHYKTRFGNYFCARYPPVVVVITEIDEKGELRQVLKSRFPGVIPTYRCGEWKVDTRRRPFTSSVEGTEVIPIVS